MTATLFSPRWHRVANLRPQLRAHVHLRQQTQRGQRWHLLLDAAAVETRRIDRSAWAFIGRMDGQRTVDQIWQALLQDTPDDAPTQDEVIRLLIQLADRRLLQFDARADIETMFQRDRQQQRQLRLTRANPIAFRLTLGNPTRLLGRLDGVARWLFSPASAIAWLLLALAGAVVGFVQWSPLAADAGELFRSSRWMLLAFLLYPPIKLVHEAAHALALRRWGGAVREVGVIVMCLMPVPFVNASAADGFRSRWQRAAVSAAGVLAELAIAALAVIVWSWLQPGLLRDLALLVAITGAVSTLLVNGNPLMRFDGYYLLCDVLDLRNLGLRSSRWWAGLLSRRILGVEPAAPVEPVPGERGWLLAYAPLAFVYRIGLSIGILLWVGGQSALLGVAVGLLLTVTLVALPLWRMLRAIARAVDGGAWPARAALRAGTAITAVALLLFVAPLPFATVAQGVVWLPEQARIRAATDGFVVDVRVKDGQRVRRGELLLRMRDQRLDAERARLEADRIDIETRLYTAVVADPRAVPGLREQLTFAEAGLARALERQAALELRAGVDGRVVLPQVDELPGQFRARGDLFGHIETGDPLVVRVALPQDDAALIRERGGPIGVRLAQAAALAHPARLQRDLPAAVDALPSRALGDSAGGDIMTDGADPDGLRTRQPVVMVDLEVAGARSPWVGGRVDVRFDHGHLSLAAQALRRVRQLVLQRFEAA